MSARYVFRTILSLSLFAAQWSLAPAQSSSQPSLDDLSIEEWNNQIRRDKFDVVLPQVMRENNVDMWIHVMRNAIPDTFGAGELGTTSGVVIFTDRGEGRIERAVLGRRWGARQRERVASEFVDPVAELKAYDIVGRPVRVHQPVGGPMTEYDYRFKGLKEFVAERDPKRIAVNFKHDLGPYVTYSRVSDQGVWDGLTHTDYLLLTEELGEELSERFVSSEYVLLDYINRKVPSEVELLRKLGKENADRARKAFDAIEPGVTKARENGVTVFRRMSTGLSQRGRSAGWEDSIVEAGDIIASPSSGMYAYVLGEGETEPPPEIQRLWAEYLKVDKILAETIKAGLTPREIIKNYTQRFEEEGIIVRGPQLHMVIPKNDFPAFAAGFDPEKTHLSVDCHGMMKGARSRPNESYFSPRIGSNGPDWTYDIPLAPNHHFVMEYFFYMPSPASEGKDQYLLWWDHEQAIATADGVEYLSPPQKDLYLIK